MYGELEVVVYFMSVYLNGVLVTMARYLKAV